MMKCASKRSANRHSKSEVVSERVEVAGARPATFKLMEKAEGSFDLFRSGQKIGTARVEGDSNFSARFKAQDEEWSATAKSAADLMQVVGRYLLTLDARASAAAPLKELEARGRKTADEKLSIAFLQQAQARRIAKLDQQVAAMRKRMKLA